MMRSRRSILESNKLQWTKRLELLSLKITELTIEPTTYEALMNDVKNTHKDILAYDPVSPHLYKKINDALNKLEDEIILLSLPVSPQDNPLQNATAQAFANKSSSGLWSFFCCCQNVPTLDDETLEPKKHSFCA